MTIKEAKCLKLILDLLSPIAILLLPEHIQKAIAVIRKAVEKKIKEYPNHFKYSKPKQ